LVIARTNARTALAAIPVLLALVATLGFCGALPASAATPTKTAKPNAACRLLTRAQIESVFTAAPLDPGPTNRTIPNARKNFTNCQWDDEAVPTTTQLAAFTTLARKVKPAQLSGLGVAAQGTAARDLTPAELQGLGDRGTVEIVRDGTYGSVGIVKGRDAMLVSVAYQGPNAPQVTEADMLAIARLAAARL
jgi:hypothetical protein